MTVRLSRRALLGSAGSLALLARAPLGFALGPAPATTATPAFFDALVARMTLDEKAGQLTLFGSAIQDEAAAAANPLGARPTAEGQLAAARAGRLTGVFNGSDPRWHLRLQQAAMRSRLKIPVIIAADVIHGFRTVFPVPLGETASFEPDLARRTARAAALEATAAGIDWTFAPMVDVARDARWGRMVEGAGEDVLLGRRFAAARVQGFQGDGGLDRPDAMLACPKHFAAYGAAEGGLDYSAADVSERTLRETYFPPFQAGFDAGALSTMAAFNEISGIPATANPWLLDDVLRGEWNFRGLVVSDYTGDWELVAHGLAVDPRDAARLAFLAGVDISMQSGLYLKYLPGLVADGAVPMARLDESVRRVLRVKAALGLFDDPYRRLAPARAAQPRRAETLGLAREAAKRSIVLLKNDGGLLPLKARGQRIALIGPMAEDAENPSGPWAIFDAGDARNTFAEGLRRAMADPADLTVVAGCRFDEAVSGGVQAAVAAAANADVAVLAIGESRAYSGEASSRTEIGVPTAQLELAAAVAATGVPIVVVLSTGRALALDGPVLAAPAILVSWFLGSASGVALADVLFGDYGPSARLPVSFPRESGQAPFHYDRKRSGRPAPADDPQASFTTHYRQLANAARFAFGHGLTYGAIEYVGLDTGDGTLAADGALEISARIRNGGARAAEEVVQLYVHDRAASVTRPIRELKDFRKVAIAPGDTATVRFTLRRADLLFVGRDLKPTVEPGLFDLWVAPSAEAPGLAGSFELLS